MAGSVKTRVPAIILAAGSSSRLGRPKQLEFINPQALHPERLLERAVRLAREAGCVPVVVVLGASARQIQDTCRLGEVHVVLNPDWLIGMSYSLRAGLHALAPNVLGIDVLGIDVHGTDVPGTVVLACDQPAVTAAHLERLIEQGLQTDAVVASAYAGRRGVPTYFPAHSWSTLQQLQGDRGARDLLYVCDALDLPDGELDVDTEESLQAARRMLRNQLRG